jgi:hypothetical protein
MRRFTTFMLVMLVGLAVGGAAVILVVLSSDEPRAPSAAPSPDPLCAGMLPRLEAANQAIEKLELQVMNPKTPPKQAGKAFEKLDEMRHDYLQIRSRAAAFGCLEN